MVNIGKWMQMVVNARNQGQTTCSSDLHSAKKRRILLMRLAPEAPMDREFKRDTRGGGVRPRCGPICRADLHPKALPTETTAVACGSEILHRKFKYQLALSGEPEGSGFEVLECLGFSRITPQPQTSSATSHVPGRLRGAPLRVDICRILAPRHAAIATIPYTAMRRAGAARAVHWALLVVLAALSTALGGCGGCRHAALQRR